MNLSEYSHRRFNPLTSQWILVSPQRIGRPWQGQIDKPARETTPPYDPACYLCPGNERASQVRNPHYPATFVFDNDFPSLLTDETAEAPNERELLRAVGTRGICRVVCFSPRHDLALPAMASEEIRGVVDVWAAQTCELGALDYIHYVQVFENKGAMMGASNPHPHCQIWATDHIPTEPAREQHTQLDYMQARHACLLCDYLALELAQGERVVAQNDHFVVVVPFWAEWPFETLVLARRHIGALTDLDDSERDALADVVKRLTTRYDNLFETSFPYSMGWHQSPTDSAAHPENHLHAHYYPPLLRSATVRKFMVGYELLAEPQRDVTPEIAAARLRELSETLYR